MPAVAQSAQRASTPPHHVICVSDKTHVTVEPDPKFLKELEQVMVKRFRIGLSELVRGTACL